LFDFLSRTFSSQFHLINSFPAPLTGRGKGNDRRRREERGQGEERGEAENAWNMMEYVQWGSWVYQVSDIFSSDMVEFSVKWFPWSEHV